MNQRCITSIQNIDSEFKHELVTGSFPSRGEILAYPPSGATARAVCMTGT
jgi:hypothetical protein